MKLQAGPEDCGLRLDVFLARRVPSFTRSQIQLLNRLGGIRIDGQQEKSGYRIRADEIIEIDLKPLEPPPLEAEQIPLQIYYEDADLAVIEKPAGLVVHPGSGATGGTLVHALLFHFKSLSDAGGQSRPGIVHRLDKKTSGLLVVAKNNTAHHRLGRAFQNRQIGKTYMALVHGKLTRCAGFIDLAIGRHPTLRSRMAAHQGSERGRSAYTEYRTLQTIRNFSLVEVQIRTGRTHQIRVHFSAIGHAVVGDDLYGARNHREFVKQYGEMNRYFLHASHLRFNHPSTGELLEFNSTLPVELQKLLERISS